MPPEEEARAWVRQGKVAQVASMRTAVLGAHGTWGIMMNPRNRPLCLVSLAGTGGNCYTC